MSRATVPNASISGDVSLSVAEGDSVDITLFHNKQRQYQGLCSIMELEFKDNMILLEGRIVAKIVSVPKQFGHDSLTIEWLVSPPAPKSCPTCGKAE